MALRQTKAKHIDRRAGAASDATTGTAVAALTIGTILTLAHPNPLVLPVLSAVLVSVGMVWALALSFRHGNEAWASDRMVIPALLAFVGFAASILSDPDRVVQSLSWVVR